MPKQPAVSIRTETYLKVQEHCKARGLKVSSFIDQLCADFFLQAPPKADKMDPQDLDPKKARF